jgi:transposase
VFVGRIQWASGEHVALIGPTGQGKTTLLLNLLPLHPYVVVFANKPRDRTMDALVRSGYRRMAKWRSIPARSVPRRVLWPPATTLRSDDAQREVFLDAMNKIYREGGWTLVMDETSYITEDLKLGKEVKTFLRLGRSLEISLVTSIQRPAWVPLEIYSQSTHLFIWKTSDEQDLSRLAGLGAANTEVARMVVANLEKYQILYINTRTGEMMRTRAPKMGAVAG